MIKYIAINFEWSTNYRWDDCFSEKCKISQNHQNSFIRHSRLLYEAQLHKLKIKSEGNRVLAQKSIFIELAVDGSTQSKNEFHMP